MGKNASKREMIPNRIFILKRPDEIDKKEAFGHWEGDSIVCPQSTVSLNVMVERQTQYVSIRRVENRGAEVTNQAMEDSLKHFKTENRQSITMDSIGFDVGDIAHPMSMNRPWIKLSLE